MENHVVKSQLVFEENGPEYYLGRVLYYDGDQYLYSETTKIPRLNEEDALFDARIMFEDRY